MISDVFCCATLCIIHYFTNRNYDLISIYYQVITDSSNLLYFLSLTPEEVAVSCTDHKGIGDLQR